MLFTFLCSFVTPTWIIQSGSPALWSRRKSEAWTEGGKPQMLAGGKPQMLAWEGILQEGGIHADAGLKHF